MPMHEGATPCGSGPVAAYPSSNASTEFPDPDGDDDLDCETDRNLDHDEQFADEETVDPTPSYKPTCTW